MQNSNVLRSGSRTGLSGRVATSRAGWLSALALVAATVPVAPANADYSFPDTTLIDRLGVSMGSLIFEHSETFLTIGQPGSGLSWVFDGHRNDPYMGTVSYWKPPAAGQHVEVKIGGVVTQFIDCPTNCTNWSGTAGGLQKTSTDWIYTARDGTVYTFNITGDMSDQNNNYPVIQLGKLVSITRPSGETITITHGTYGLKSVVSSLGYALKYTGESPTAISVVNLASHTCDAQIVTCDGVDGTISFAYPSSLPSTITDDAGRVWEYRIGDIPSYQDPRNPIDYANREALYYFKSPDGYQVSLTYDIAGRLTQLTDNRGNWNYTYPGETLLQAKINGSEHNIEVSGPGGLLYTSFSSHEIPSYSRDANGNATAFGISRYQIDRGGLPIYFTRLAAVQHQEGNTRSLTFDDRGNIKVATDTPKASSGQTATTLQATYPSTCTNPKTCNKPTSETDARGNVTNYTYDASHGGVLSVMGPPPTAGAARPLKLTSYAQKTPYYRNPSGVMTASTTPVWVVSTETECQTVAGSSSPVCDGAAPSRVTTYEYGATGTANALWPRGIAVTAGSVTLRTCYTYDNLGRKLSETKPMANLAVCQ